MAERDRKRPRADAPASAGAAVGADGGSAAGAADGLEAHLAALQAVQDKLDRVEEEASAAILEIQRKTAQIQRPLYDERDAAARRVDGFWLTAMLGCQELAEVVAREDEAALEHCTSVHVEDNQDAGWRVTFRFSAANPFFSDRELTKSCAVGDDGSFAFSCPEIHWRPGQDLTAGEGGSFFEWFSHVPGDAQSDGDPDEDGGEVDWIADVIVRTLWPRAVEHYLGGLGDG